MGFRKKVRQLIRIMVYCINSVFVACFVMHCFVPFCGLCLFIAVVLVCVWGWACFALCVFLDVLNCDCDCSVSLPHGVMGWPAVCDCGIF